MKGIGVSAFEEGELLGIGDAVDLVKEGDDRFFTGTKFFEDFEGGVVKAFDFMR